MIHSLLFPDTSWGLRGWQAMFEGCLYQFISVVADTEKF